MKVLFLAAYSNLAAASRIKVYQFLPLLEEKGIKCKVICFTPSFLYRIRLFSTTNKALIFIYYPLSYIIRSSKTLLAVAIASKFDVVFIQEPIIPFGLERLLKLVNKNIVFQITDAVFLDQQKTDNFFERLRVRTLFKYWKRIAMVARCCLVENDYNKVAVLKFCPNIHKIIGPMDVNKYFIREDKKEGNNIIIGWIGTPFTTKYLYEVKDVFMELSKKYDIILRLVGAKKDFKIDGVNYEIKEWKLDAELKWLSTFNIGIMPLSDDMWTKGKGGYKLLQYMSMGIPAVVSAIGVNKEIVDDEVDGFLCGTKEEWVKKLSVLIEDKKIREKIGKNARDKIEKHYSLEKATTKLIKIFENTIK
jgi:glycosyltransferase involved in cell wall biosynthesis